MRIAVVTLFPEMFKALTDFGISRRAVNNELLTISTWNPRSYTNDRHQTVDDRPYGGGPGMVMMIEPLKAAIDAAKAWLSENGKPSKVIYLSPQGQVLNQAGVQTLAETVKAENLLLIAGRYEGIDERLLQMEVDEEWSIGDYVLSGGELPAMVLLDAVIRLLPGALGHENSAAEDSFSDGLLDCPHYTRPEVYEGNTVPSVLLSGNHAAIKKWRLEQSLERTRKRRPDLLKD
jgi:tRNA (guanine37-N1)-methyltransferase